MNNLLQLDLNELVSKEISEKVSQLEHELTAARDKIAELRKEIAPLNKKIGDSQTLSDILVRLRLEFSEIKEGKHDSGDYFDSK